MDAPTLFESRADDFCDLIISVVAKPELRMQRIMERDHISMAAAETAYGNAADRGILPAAFGHSSGK
ncbi:MAG: dephospho-CoA kinase [Ruminococcus sp.]